jgi:peptide/nickel transport system permease protein
MRRTPVRSVARAVVILVVSGLCGATLVRLAPGFGIDERALDPRLSWQTRQSIDGEHASEQNPFRFYAQFLAGMLRGDAGRSVVFGEPVGQLIRERLPATLRAVLFGLALGWCAALVCAGGAALHRRAASTVAAMALSGTLLSTPSALLAIACLLLRAPPAIAIAAVIFPRIFPYAYWQLRSNLTAPHVVMAQGRGLSPTRLFVFHVVPPALMPLVALAGVSVPLAFGASIPVEAIADVPGIGQLAWRAALGRDLPVLVAVTLLLTAITVSANLAADLVLTRLSGRES